MCIRDSASAGECRERNGRSVWWAGNSGKANAWCGNVGAWDREQPGCSQGLRASGTGCPSQVQASGG
eukprot:3008222-Alexandrium_andersonii.AAC.1